MKINTFWSNPTDIRRLIWKSGFESQILFWPLRSLRSLSAVVFLCISRVKVNSFQSYTCSLCHVFSDCRAMLASSAAFAIMQCSSVCLSVCVCVCLSRSYKMGKHIIRFFSPSGRPIILVFPNETGRQ